MWHGCNGFRSSSSIEAPDAQRFRLRPGSVDARLSNVNARIFGGHGDAPAAHAEALALGADFRAIFEAAPIGILQVDLRGGCLSSNPSARQMFGYSEREFGQLRAVHLLAEDLDDDAFDLFERATARHEARLRRRDGRIFWGSITVTVVGGGAEGPAFAYAMIEEIAARQASEDPVTGLPNRTLFLERVRRGLLQARRLHEGVAVLYIDLDGFKAVNDQFGHDAGDEVLAEVGLRLVRTIRATDVVARMGGDEFAVLLTGIVAEEQVAEVATKVERCLEQPFMLSAGASVIGGSIGAALSPRDGADAKSLVEHADQSMYALKRQRKLAPRGAVYERASGTTTV